MVLDINSGTGIHSQEINNQISTCERYIEVIKLVLYSVKHDTLF